jgi:hypothetical protein
MPLNKSSSSNTTPKPSPRGLFSQHKTDYISVQSFSFENCLFHQNLSVASYDDKDKAFLRSNKGLLGYMKEKNIHASKVICMIGSNPGTETSPFRFKIFHKVSRVLKHLLPSQQCESDEYLIADTYGNRPAGYNYANAVKGHKTFDDYIVDTSNLSILYAQTHKIASEHPDKHIEFTFYDNDQTKLFALANFYKMHPEKLPDNTKLKLRFYNGDDIYVIADIVGTGPIDRDYELNIKHMVIEVLTDSNQKIRKELLDGNLNLIDELNARDNLTESLLKESARNPLKLMPHY